MGALISDEKALVELKEPLKICMHGTYERFMPKIETEGLKRMDRKHIHMTKGLPGSGVISGMRASCEVYLYVDMAKAMADGIIFYESSNGVVLTEGIDGILPYKYIKEAVRKSK